MRVRAVLRIAAALIVANAIAIGVVWACGPFIVPIATVSVVFPADSAAFARGEVGVVRPRFTRATLAMAYRTLNGQGPLQVGESPAPGSWPDDRAWREIARRNLDSATGPARTRRLIDYATPLNCLQDAYDTAVRTFEARQQHYGAGSAPLRAWVEAQAAVFANCEEDPLMLPAPAPPSADSLTKADRAYQTAAAYFYAMRYDEAERRFRAIAEDATSPWRPYGRYLAARSVLRLATMGVGADEAKQQAFRDAEQELLAVTRDPVAAPVHASAKGLIAFVRVRVRPFDELRDVAARLASPAPASGTELVNLTYLLDREIGNTIDFDYKDVASIDRLRGSHDLIDWVVAFQGKGPEARARAIARWRETRSMPWLVAALTHVTAPDEAAKALLDAAAAVPSSSPAFATLAFHRVRLLIGMGQIDSARRLLAALPDQEAPGVSRETVNLYRAERLMIASTLEEFLAAAARQSLLRYGSPSLQVFDEDAGTAFNERFSLESLIEAGLSATLPPRLRTRVATAGFTRAILLNRHDSARRIAPVLRTLAPDLSVDIDRYMQETTPEGRRRAAVLLILRTPGMTTDVRGLDDSYSVDFAEPRRTFESFVPVWWCGTAPAGRARGAAASELIHALSPDHEVGYPAWMTAEERATVERERTSLDATGRASRFLATAALEWARDRPADPEAAEALARIVSGWRRTCRDNSDGDLARQSFEALHRQFPNSEWAKRTKFWYR